MTMLYLLALQNGHSKDAGETMNSESNNIGNMVFVTTFLTL